MRDIPGARERPGDSGITLEESDDDVIVTIPPRGILFPLPIFLLFDVLAVLFLLVVAVEYVVFHRAIFTGLQPPPPNWSTAAGHRLLIAFVVGWFVTEAVLISFFLLIWLPLITREVVSFTAKELVVTRSAPGRFRELHLTWPNVDGWFLQRDPLNTRPSRLLLTHSGGKEFIVAEFARDPEREWLESVFHILTARRRPH